MKSATLFLYPNTFRVVDPMKSHDFLFTIDTDQSIVAKFFFGVVLTIYMKKGV
jgi:hypothetical protein